jgi:hypothetical protein
VLVARIDAGAEPIAPHNALGPGNGHVKADGDPVARPEASRPTPSWPPLERRHSKGTEMLHRATAISLVLVASSFASTVVEAAKGDRGVPGNPSAATFDDGQIDLGESWGEAAACIELGDHTECFRSEEQLFQTYPEYGADAGSAQSAAPTEAFVSSSREFTVAATCSSSLRLYRLTGFTGGTLVLTTRGVVLNLSTYGFDNDTNASVGAADWALPASAPYSG